MVESCRPFRQNTSSAVATNSCSSNCRTPAVCARLQSIFDIIVKIDSVVKDWFRLEPDSQLERAVT